MRLLYLYGYHVLVAVREAHEMNEAYEHCAAITTVLHDFSVATGVQVPARIDSGTMEDYKAEFWRMGIAGRTAETNFMSYAMDAYIESMDLR